MTDPAGQVDRSSPVPFHHQLRKHLERQIETGRWAPGERLPSEPSLSEHYRVSRTTVRQALDTLVQQGLISKEKGRGAFVNHVSPAWLLQCPEGLTDTELSRHGVTVESAVLKAFVERLPHWAADALQLEHDAKGVTIERVRRVGGELALYVVNHLPVEYTGVIEEIQSSPRVSLYSVLLDRYGVRVAGSSRTLEAVAAPPLVSRLLGCQSDTRLSISSQLRGTRRTALSTAIGRGCAPTVCGSPLRPTARRHWRRALSAILLSVFQVTAPHRLHGSCRRVCPARPNRSRVSSRDRRRAVRTPSRQYNRSQGEARGPSSRSRLQRGPVGPRRRTPRTPRSYWTSHPSPANSNSP